MINSGSKVRAHLAAIGCNGLTIPMNVVLAKFIFNYQCMYFHYFTFTVTLQIIMPPFFLSLQWEEQLPKYCISHDCDRASQEAYQQLLVYEDDMHKQ